MMETNDRTSFQFDSTIGRASFGLGFLEKTEINEMSETFVLIHGA